MTDCTQLRALLDTGQPCPATLSDDLVLRIYLSGVGSGVASIVTGSGIRRGVPLEHVEAEAAALAREAVDHIYEDPIERERILQAMRALIARDRNPEPTRNLEGGQ